MVQDGPGSGRSAGALGAWDFGAAGTSGATVTASRATGRCEGRRGLPGLSAHVLARRVRKSPVLLATLASLLFIPVVTRVGPLGPPSLQPAAATVMTLCGLAAAWLLQEQFVHTRRLSDLLILAAVATVGLLNLSLHMVPASLGIDSTSQLLAAQVWGQLFVGGFLAAAVLARPDRLVLRARSPVMVLITIGGVAIGLAAVCGVTFSSAVAGPVVSHPTIASGPAGHPVGLAVTLLAVGLMSLAAVRLSAHRAPSDVPVRIVGAAVALLAAGSTYQLLSPLPASRQVSLAEVPGFAASALLLLAAWRYEPQTRARLARAAALAERRRVAQDLHDGLAQDLAYIAAHGSAIAAGVGNEHPIVVAARRALSISRSTISTLSDPAGASTAEALEAVAGDLHERFGVAIAVESQLQDDLSPEEREQVSRIAREAIANAARHGEARNVVVSLTRCERAVVLRIVDDGRGIRDRDGQTAREGFGLRSIRQRAHDLGGFMVIHQPRFGGTQLEVVFPS
jgi:signal transduction histidine kinase